MDTTQPLTHVRITRVFAYLTATYRPGVYELVDANPGRGQIARDHAHVAIDRGYAREGKE